MTAQKQAPLPGARPEGAGGEREAAARVRDMFSRIAPHYDFLNHLLSFSLDHLWRRRTAKRFGPILRRPEAHVLDLCCGTGDLAFALASKRGVPRPPKTCGGPSEPTAVIGSDFVVAMLERAREKAREGKRGAIFVAADALQLPFADASFDLVTTAFGFRNLANYESGLREMARVLRCGGEAGILEFGEPRPGPFSALFRFYFRQVLPRIGGAISGSREAYAYLPSSVARFPSPGELAALMEENGFTDVGITSWNFGSVTLYSARMR